MSTLGYGDISFTSDIGRVFSILVLLSGILFMLIILPFTFIEFLYIPWMTVRAEQRIPRKVAANLTGHVILTFYGPVAKALIEKLNSFSYPYVVILSDKNTVTALKDNGVECIFGELSEPETYYNVNVQSAAMVATTQSDIINTSVVFTVRGITEKTPVIATARETASSEVLELAGCTRILDLTLLTAEALSRRVKGGRQFTHIIGKIDDLLICEIDVNRTSLAGKRYVDAQRETSINIIGFWDRGDFEVGTADSVVKENNLLMAACTKEQLKEFADTFRIDADYDTSRRVIIIGGGRVGRATAASVTKRSIDYRIIELLQERVLDNEFYVHGSATDRAVLQEAGIEEASSIIITTHDDETNIFLTILCRLLRPDIQIICRATEERKLGALQRAGADIVMSYASIGSNALFNILQRSDLLLVAEGLDVFKVKIPPSLAGKTLLEIDIFTKTHCSVIGFDIDGTTITNPSLDLVIPHEGEIILIGSPDSEAKFFRTYS